jgi:uncharacterized protein YcnI
LGARQDFPEAPATVAMLGREMRTRAAACVERVEPRLRGAALFPVAALAVHQLRYELAFGGGAGEELAAQGHSYLEGLTLPIVLLVALAAGAFAGRLAGGARGVGRPERRRAPGRPAVRAWLLVALALVAIYAGQETLEGLLSTGHPGGLAGVFGDGGWLAIPVALAVAVAVVAILRLAAVVLARARRPAPGRVARTCRGLTVACHARRRTPAPLARLGAERAPPRRRARGDTDFTAVPGPGAARPAQTADRARVRPAKGPLPMPHRPVRPRARAALAAGSAALALALPAAAQAHVSLHPNVVPAGAFATLTLRVPNETDNATTTGVAVQMPEGFLDVSAAPPPGWKFATKEKKLATPVKTDDGTIDTEVTEIDFTGGALPPGQFVQLPISVVIPGKAGDVLTFKVVQTYSDGKTSRWIGAPDSDTPAPTIDVSAKGGPLVDIAGGEAGPPASAGTASTTSSRPSASARPTATAAPAQVVKSGGSGKGIAIAALIVAVIAAALGGVAVFRRPAGAPAQ